MEFNVSQFIKKNPGAIKSFSLLNHVFYLQNQVEYKTTLIHPTGETNLSGSAEMIRTDVGIWVTALLTCEVNSQCSRCLNTHTRKLSLKINEEYYVNSYASNNLEIEETQYITNDNILDLTDSIRDHIELEIPLNPICDETCAGICVNCGLNLNLDSCIC
ncbi:MAG: hypothetical protein CL904_03310 [Dehalococcoidia bacterium]|nr:hypothetical protein [Dehalococcoidia bacterium]MQG15516.1 DUF177 domain-containing protein [SAR202 cluster bacterium]|tara:strand:- start:11060 stop:11539 length:480 start_codon:yes stop_codon:yes gene_type:complete